MPTGPEPICTLCRHEHETDSTLPGSGWSCNAFPTGIPQDIILGTVIHTKPVEGDGGIQFEKREGVAQSDVDALLE